MFITNLLQQKSWGAKGVLPRAQELGSTWVRKRREKKKKTEFAKLKDPKGFSRGSVVKNPPAMQETQV